MVARHPSGSPGLGPMDQRALRAISLDTDRPRPAAATPATRFGKARPAAGTDLTLPARPGRMGTRANRAGAGQPAAARRPAARPTPPAVPRAAPKPAPSRSAGPPAGGPWVGNRATLRQATVSCPSRRLASPASAAAAWMPALPLKWPQPGACQALPAPPARLIRSTGPMCRRPQRACCDSGTARSGNPAPWRTYRHRHPRAWRRHGPHGRFQRSHPHTG